MQQWGARRDDDGQRTFKEMRYDVYKGRDEVSAGEDHQEHDDREHGEETRRGKVGF